MRGASRQSEFYNQYCLTAKQPQPAHWFPHVSRFLKCRDVEILKVAITIVEDFGYLPLKNKRHRQSPSLLIVPGLSSKMQWLVGLCYADFISTPALLSFAEWDDESNSNELPISVHSLFAALFNFQ